MDRSSHTRMVRTMIRFWVGVDVSKRKLDVALMDERGKYKSRVFENTVNGFGALIAWLEE